MRVRVHGCGRHRDRGRETEAEAPGLHLSEAATLLLERGPQAADELVGCRSRLLLRRLLLRGVGLGLLLRLSLLRLRLRRRDLVLLRLRLLRRALLRLPSLRLLRLPPRTPRPPDLLRPPRRSPRNRALGLRANDLALQPAKLGLERQTFPLQFFQRVLR